MSLAHKNVFVSALFAVSTVILMNVFAGILNFVHVVIVDYVSSDGQYMEWANYLLAPIYFFMSSFMSIYVLIAQLLTVLIFGVLLYKGASKDSLGLNFVFAFVGVLVAFGSMYFLAKLAPSPAFEEFFLWATSGAGFGAFWGITYVLVRFGVSAGLGALVVCVVGSRISKRKTTTVENAVTV